MLKWIKPTIRLDKPEMAEIVRVKDSGPYIVNVLALEGGMRTQIYGVWGYKGDKLLIRRKFVNGKFEGVVTTW